MISRARVLPLVVLAGILSCADDTKAPGPKTPAAPIERYDDVPVTSTVEVSGLRGRVDAVRDKYGMVHIRAGSMADALRVEGYHVARDRTAQLELIRRSATGRMAEILGDAAPSLIDSDIAIRTVGLNRAAKEMAAALTPELRALVEAYADGISQFNARVVTGDEELPAGMIGLSQSAFQPWTVEDVLAVARYQSFNLGYQADDEIALSELVTAARTKFKGDDADEGIKARSKFLLDMVRFAPLDPATPLTEFPNDLMNVKSVGPKTATPRATTRSSAREFHASREALVATQTFRNAVKEIRRLVGDHELGSTGSNNWVVGPTHSMSGNALLASDPHLTLSAPAVFWMVHVTIDGNAPEAEKADYAGLSFPGIPGIILGFNQNVAWGATTADYDVTDVYEETLSADGNGVVFKNQTVPFQHVKETIAIAGGKTYDYDLLVVPHHGPIVPAIQQNHTVTPPPPSGKALSVKWTGHKATKDVEAILGLLQAKNVEDARKSLNDFGVGAQNWVVADSHGDIFYTSHAQIPKRDRAAFDWHPDTFTGNLPCFVLPGDGTAEWTGAMIEDGYVPHVKNPPKGYLATANTDQVGTVNDNDPSNDKLPNGEPVYTGCWHDVGFRLARIQTRLEETDKHTLETLAQIQADAKSAMGMKLAPRLRQALTNADEEKKQAGRHKDLTAIVSDPRFDADLVSAMNKLLAAWETAYKYDAASGMTPDNKLSDDASEIDASRATAVFNVWLARMAHLTFDDEWKVLGTTGALDWRKQLVTLMTSDAGQLGTFWDKTASSAIFDDLGTPDVQETLDERAVRSMVDALEFLKTRLGPDTSTWRWGRLHTIRFGALVSLWSSLSIPPVPDEQFPIGFPRHGDGYNVDVAAWGLPAALDDKASFGYSHGPTQRLVIEMTPTGPIARNALPGGNVWDSRNDHFRDEAERWRRNQNRPVPFAARDVIDAAEGRVVFTSAAPKP